MSTTSIKELQQEVYQTALDHGWWDNGDRNFGEVIALVHSELSEALEQWRLGKSVTETYINPKTGKWEGVPVELADAIIRILDFCGRNNIDMETVLNQKNEINKTRPYKHGKIA